MSPTTSPATPVRAAGCVVWRTGGKGSRTGGKGARRDGKEPEVLLVHRPRWEDWSFPKGKLDRGETWYAAAVREVLEETGLAVRLGPRLPDVHYTVSGANPRKTVQYWCAKAPKSADITTFEPNDEIDELRWVPASKALRTLSYSYDSDLLQEFLATAYDTSPLLVIRHAHARSRKAWRHDDVERPLKAEGKEQAHRLVPLLAAYDVKRVISSDALRCVDSVLPYVNTHPAKLTLDPSLSEESFDLEAMQRRVGHELAGRRRVAICSQRPVLPDLQRALGVEPRALDPGALLVLHRRDGRVESVEHYPTP